MDQIAATIVTYNPDFNRLKENVKYIAPQVDAVFIVDNGSLDQETLILFCQQFGIHYMALNDNKGIAYALNQGLNLAQSSGCTWSVMLDQDSVVPADLIEQYRVYFAMDRVAMLCPRIDYHIGTLAPLAEPYQSVRRCITSASCVNVELSQLVGGYNNDLFIDYVDYEFSARLIEHGYSILQINTVILDHQLGTVKFVKAFPVLTKKRVATYNHSPQRTYYFVRNSVYYCRRFKRIINVRHEQFEVFRWLVVKCLYEPHRLKTLSAIFRGLRDGLAMEVKV